MQILDKIQNLEGFLSKLSKKNICIVTAFASGTEDLIDILLENNNQIDLIVGTINSFSSPSFFDHCLSINSEKLSLYVDFKYQNSTHWKLYLIAPNIVVIGSANFTDTGMSLIRDTCVIIEDSNLYKSYLNEVAKIKSAKDVIGTRDRNFKKQLEIYRLKHHRMQAGFVRSNQCTNGIEWLKDDTNQIVPLFIWDVEHTKEDKEAAYKHIESDSDGMISRTNIRDFFTDEYKAGVKLPYEQGDVVLCAKMNGCHINFFTFDRIIIKDDQYYMYSYRRPRYTYPFRLNDLREEIKERVPDWYKDELTKLSRQDIYQICESAKL